MLAPHPPRLMRPLRVRCPRGGIWEGTGGERGSGSPPSSLKAGSGGRLRARGGLRSSLLLPDLPRKAWTLPRAAGSLLEGRGGERAAGTGGTGRQQGAGEGWEVSGEDAQLPGCMVGGLRVPLLLSLGAGERSRWESEPLLRGCSQRWGRSGRLCGFCLCQRTGRGQELLAVLQWVFAPLLLLLAELGSGLQPTYQWRDAETNEKLTCQQCPPGTFVARHCTRDRQTECEPCPELHYTQYWNYLEKCRYCNVICEEKQVEVQQCNATHNRVCQCQEGYYSEMEFCIRHSECPPGSGVVKPGTPFEDTQCRRCPRGFFSSSPSTEPCQPHQDCAQQGKVINVQGNEYHDTLCTSCRAHGRSNSTQGPAPGDEDCEQAMIDFVAYQNISPKKLKRLQHILDGSLKKEVSEKKALIQEKFRAFLTHLKEGNPAVTKELLEALRATKLHAIEREVRKRFLLSN